MFGTNLPRTSNSPSEMLKVRFETSKLTTYLDDVDEVGLGRRCSCNIDWCCTYAWHSPTSFTTRSLRVVVRVQARAQRKDFKVWYQDVWDISWPPQNPKSSMIIYWVFFVKASWKLRFFLMRSCRLYLKTIGVLEVIDWLARCSRHLPHLPWGIDGSQLFVFGRSLGGAGLLRMISSLSTKTGKPCKQVRIEWKVNHLAKREVHISETDLNFLWLRKYVQWRDEIHGDAALLASHFEQQYCSKLKHPILKDR